MPLESKQDLPLEIGHVLFIDIVGYSKLLINEQSELLEHLKTMVRSSEQVRAAEAAGKLIRLATGDGMALVFRNSPEAPAQCALELARADKEHSELKLRMGIHSGPINEVTDVNERANVTGAGINMAQRVMDCGDAGHILLSKRAAEDLAQYRHWQPLLHDVGEVEVKHGVRFGIVSLHGDGFGNPALPEKAQSSRPDSYRFPWPAIFILLVSLGAVIYGFFLFYQNSPPPQRPLSPPKATPPAAATPALPVIPEKSIAVLPFENLSEEKANAYFADGVQDEILTRLAKVADLKVVSHTSTQRFESAPENLSHIAQQLGVANILEGSVQKSNNQVRVNVQLIKAATNAHLWADTYDRKLTDIFAVESEIAETIADTLQAKLSGREMSGIAHVPTEDMVAHELYLQGRHFWRMRGDNLLRAIEFYNQAIARDPKYALAYAGLGETYILLPYYTGADPKEVNLKARAAALKAIELNPDLAEAHNAFAKIVYADGMDMETAIREHTRAIALSPNYAAAYHWLGNGPLLNLGRFDEAIAAGKRSTELDPLSAVNMADLGVNYMDARRFPEAEAAFKRALEIDPAFPYTHWFYGELLQTTGDLEHAAAEYRKARAGNDKPQPIALIGQLGAIMGRPEEAVQALAELDELGKNRYVGTYWRALLYLSRGDKNQALQALEKSVVNGYGTEIGLIKVDPMLASLHGDPRFEALVTRVLEPKTGTQP